MKFQKEKLNYTYRRSRNKSLRPIKLALYLLPAIAMQSWGDEFANCAIEMPTANVEMEYVDICDKESNCKKFSRLVMGTDHLIQANWVVDGQQEISNEELDAILDEAVKLGINTFDTSPIYVGDIENKLGKWLDTKNSKVREDGFYHNENLNPDRELYTISKGGFPLDLYYWQKLESGSHSDEFLTVLNEKGILSEKSTMMEDGSIKIQNAPSGTYSSRLYGDKEQIKERVSGELHHTTNHLSNDITVYLMHRDDADFFKFEEIDRPQTPVNEILKALSSEEIADKVWQIGLSNWRTPRVNESLKVATENAELLKPVINSPYFSLFEMSKRTIHAGGVQVFHKEMNNPEFQKGIKIMPYSPLGGFSILDKPEPRWDNAKASAKEKYDAGDPYWQNVFYSIFTEDNRQRYERVVQFTNDFNYEHCTNYTVDQMINAYALAHKRTDMLAVGPITIPQLRRTVASLGLSKMLTDDDLEYLYYGVVAQQ
ncbi:hypothetical protein C942_04873 [Photobacterium marinum]|uniref:NADP-dependent oxidoreductase domain-containing protein n=1 Tax=Photobacterium marinum TaxID=1056511 RepID=L8JBT7_9GAMM|nr:aldo/keto reductase [Photobacterium marinum]ELR66285.1 hypothetical protein C942_04873 [Photobacterium marinum]